MAKKRSKDPIVKARKKLARAQSEYLKVVAKGERQIKNVRAEVDERIARAKAEFDMRADELTEAERDVLPVNGTATDTLSQLIGDVEQVAGSNGTASADDGKSANPLPSNRPRKRSTSAADA